MGLNVLFVDDDEHDLLFLKLTLEQSEAVIAPTYLNSAEEVLDHLQTQPAPDLIVTDLSMPTMNGLELTHALKQDDRYRRIPVWMLTGSTAPEDVNGFYQEAGNAYIRKPSSPDGYEHLINEISHFWDDVAIRPERRH